MPRRGGSGRAGAGRCGPCPIDTQPAPERKPPEATPACGTVAEPHRSRIARSLGWRAGPPGRPQPGSGRSRQRAIAEVSTKPVHTPLVAAAPDLLGSAQSKLARARILAEDGGAEEAWLLATEARAEAAEARIAAIEADRRQTAAALGEFPEQNAALSARLAEMEAEERERGIVVILGDVLFRTDEAAPTPEGRAKIARIAGYLRASPGQSVVIEGHTDAGGSERYNLALSEARAEAVTAALLAEGIGSKRVVHSGVGEGSPIASNATPTGRQLTRRVGAILVDRG